MYYIMLYVYLVYKINKKNNMKYLLFFQYLNKNYIIFEYFLF